MPENRILAAALAAVGAVMAIPIPLAQLDFAGLFNAFDIHHGDAPQALLVMAAIGGCLTVPVIGAALAGACLAFSGAPSARPLLLGAAVAGLVTAMPLWVPTAIVLGAAALVLERAAGTARPT
jgi:hypothetical protein